MRKSDEYRKSIINQIITEGKTPNNRVKFTYNGEVNSGYYSEVITIDEISKVFGNNVLFFLEDFTYNRISNVLTECGYSIKEESIDLTSSDFYDGYQINIPVIKEGVDDVLESIFNEIDQELGLNNEPQKAPKEINKQLDNTAKNVPLTKEPTAKQTPHLPTQAKTKKTQNPKRVDLLLKSTFESKFNEYKLSSDVGDWKPIKTLKDDGKLMVTWESVKEPSMLIETILFPADTNKIKIKVKRRNGGVLINHFFEIYRIPTDEFLAEKFFRKTYFNLLKKFIDTKVITLEPFKTDFIFWKTDNPAFSYSFSSPNKNKIILDLISFISTARKPILDDFFEQNNLKHKQGYLQTLLDAAEAAGIFRFKREGNEIIILKGPNYKHFLEGKVRRVTT